MLLVGALRTGSVNLGQGFPDRDGPESVVEEVVRAVRGGANQYAPGIGVPVASQTAKRETLRRILAQDEVTNAIIFCNRKTTVRDLNKVLKQAGYKSGEIHGDMEQPQRLAELDVLWLLEAGDAFPRDADRDRREAQRRHEGRLDR